MSSTAGLFIAGQQRWRLTLSVVCALATGSIVAGVWHVEPGPLHEALSLVVPLAVVTLLALIVPPPKELESQVERKRDLVVLGFCTVLAGIACAIVLVQVSNHEKDAVTILLSVVGVAVFVWVADVSRQLAEAHRSSK